MHLHQKFACLPRAGFLGGREESFTPARLAVDKTKGLAGIGFGLHVLRAQFSAVAKSEDSI
jgi:hypothetical protein